MRSILYIIILQLLICACSQQSAVRIPKEIMKEGDIVFRRGTGLTSRVVIEADNEGRYSHVGIVVSDGELLKIVHAVPGERKEGPDMVEMESVESFFDKGKSVAGAIMRFKGDSCIAINAAQRAKAIYERKTEFDHSYNHNDTMKMYCTELVEYSYNKAGYSLTKGKTSTITFPALSGEYILPSDIVSAEKLEPIFIY